MKICRDLSVVVAGDLCMRTPLDALIGSGNEAMVFSGIRPVLESADIRM